jgi:hypothetical protein
VLFCDLVGFTGRSERLDPGAEALLAPGRRHEGEAELARALAFFRSVGAAADVGRGEAVLAATA